MKTARLYIVPLFLIASSLMLTVRGVAMKKDAAALQMKALAQGAPVKTDSAVAAKNVVPAMSISEIMTLNRLIGILAAGSQIPLKEQIINNSISYTSAPEVLENYDGLLNFMSSISALPYPIQYDKMCLGTGCRDGFEMSLKLAE